MKESVSVRWLRRTTALSGLLLGAFVAVHMVGNLTLLGGIAVFDSYVYALRELLSPPMPRQSVLWGMRIILLGLSVVHVAGALTLRYSRAGAAWRAAPHRHGVPGSRAMLLTGVLIAGFLVFHVAHLTAMVVVIGTHPRALMAFQHWELVAVYAVAMAALCVHAGRGTAAAIVELWPRAATRLARLRTASAVAAVLICAALMIGPVLVLVGRV